MPGPLARICSLALALLLPALLRPVSSFQDTDRFMRSRSKPKQLDRETLRREITASMELLEPLARRLSGAAKAEQEEAWASGVRDFRLPRGAVADCRASVGRLWKLFAHEPALEAARQALKQAADPAAQARARKGLEKAEEKAKALKEAARDKLRAMHRKPDEDLIRDLRNWITVSEGSLRKSQEKAAPAALSGTAK